MSIEKERAGFESWFSDGGRSPRAVERGPDGGYLLAQAASAWTAWRARADWEIVSETEETK